MKCFLYLLILPFLWFGIASPCLFAQEVDPPTQDKPVEEQPPVVPDTPSPLDEHRARFSEAETDAGTLAISAGELIKAGDQDWLRSQLMKGEVADATALAIVSAFVMNQDLSALSEILLLTQGKNHAAVKKRCRKALTTFLTEPETREATVDQLMMICERAESAPELLLAGLSALGEAGELKAVDILIPVLTHENPRIQAQAMLSLQRLTYQEIGADEGAWKVWWEKNSHLSRDCLIEPVLTERITGLDQEVERLKNQNLELALQLIESSPDKAIDFLDSDELRIRRPAAEAVSAKTDNPERARVKLDAVIAHLQKGEDDEEVLKLLLAYIGQDEIKAPATQELLLNYLNQDPRDAIKAVAASSLHGFKNNTVRERAVSLLRSLQETEGRAELKAALLNLIYVLRNVDDLALFIPFTTLQNDMEVRRWAVKALGQTRKEEAIDLLMNILREDPEYQVRFEVTSSLAVIGKSGTPENGLKEKAASTLTRGLIDREPRVRRACVDELARLDAPGTFEIFSEHLVTETDGNVREWYVKGLGQLGNPEGVTVICNALPESSGPEEENQIFFENAREAVALICGDDLAMWINAADTFFNAQRYGLTVSCCENYLSRAKDKNGENGHVKEMKARLAKSRTQLFVESGELAKALEQKRLLAEEIDPENNDYLREYAESLAAAGQFKKGAQAYAKLIARFPADDAGALWALKAEGAACNLKIGDAAAAQELLKGFNPAQAANLPEAVRNRVTQVLEDTDAALEQGARKRPAPGTPMDPGKAEGAGDPAGKSPSQPGEGSHEPKGEDPRPEDGLTGKDPSKTGASGGKGSP